MTTKQFKGKAIYNPSGKAGEYSYWACNFYVGCSNGCEYCYCKKGILAGTMGQDKPQLKACFKDEGHAMEVFRKELKENLEELRTHGIFFSFTTDPMLNETINLTLLAIHSCIIRGVPVKILTKNAENTLFAFIGVKGLTPGVMQNFFQEHRRMFSIGFTLTGHDELEPGASPNAERIAAMQELHYAGFKTFASIEPIIDFESSFEMILRAQAYCDLFLIGLKSGVKYLKHEVQGFISSVNRQCNSVKIYWKDSLLKAAGIDRGELPSNCVSRDYNIFS